MDIIKAVSKYQEMHGDLTGDHRTKPIPEFKFALREDVKEDKRFLPTQSENTASGWDVKSCQEDRKPIVLRAGQYAKIPLGFRLIAPSNYWVELRPRSSSFAKKYLNSL